MEKETYCVKCGAKVTADTAVCPTCRQKLPAKDRLLLHFLWEHTKDKIKGDIEDSVFEAIKNFLLSHLYGLVVGLSLIVVAAVAIFNPAVDAHIRKVDSIEQIYAAEENAGGYRLTEQDKMEIAECMTSYVTSLDDAKFMAGNGAYLYIISDELFESMNSDTPMELYYNYYNDEENFPYIRAEDEPRNKAVTTGFTTEEKTENMTILRGMGYEVAAATVTHSFYAAARGYSKNVYPRRLIAQCCEAPFEDGVYPISQGYDELLRILYGDYMVIPGPEKRIRKVHTVLIDLDRSYEEYEHYRDGMKFDVCTRSIR